MSRGPIPDYPPDRPKVPDVVPLIRAIYASPDGGVGCCLHILTDDDNYDCAASCLQYARKRGHELCARAAEMLTRMSPSQVRRAVATYRAGR